MEDKNETRAKIMFENLKQHLGEDIIYQTFYCGDLLTESSKLIEVENFNSIIVEDSIIPFIGYGSAIKMITAKNGEILYYNPYLESNCHCRTREGMYKVRKQIFGSRVANIEKIKQEHIEKQLDWKKEEERNKKAKANKYHYMKLGLENVDPNLIEEWLKFVDVNTNDFYSATVVLATIDAMKELSEGSNCELVEKIYSDLDLIGFMASYASQAVSYFHKTRGGEFKNYWNSKYEITDIETKNFANPIVLTLKKQ